jgi:hypothetical protein
MLFYLVLSVAARGEAKIQTWNIWHGNNVRACKVNSSNGNNNLSLRTLWPLVRKRTIPTERPPLVGEVSANFCG